MTGYETYDGALERCSRFAPWYSTGFSNHAPMVVEALAALGRGRDADAFLDAYEPRLGGAPESGRVLTPDEVLDTLGRNESYPDHLATFTDAIDGVGWEDVLGDWLPVLVPGILAHAGHGWLRTFHVWRALRVEVTPARTAELARALAYWSSTHQSLGATAARDPDGAGIEELLGRIPRAAGAWYMLDTLAVGAAGDAAVRAVLEEPRSPEVDPVSPITRAGAAALLARPAGTIAFVHAVTVPSALRTARPWMQEEVFESAVDRTWQIVAAWIAATTGSGVSEEEQDRAAPLAEGWEGLVDAAVACGDEHVTKLVEAASREEAATGDDIFRIAAATAVTRMRPSQ